jgi:AcrR family transcriptional regulator
MPRITDERREARREQILQAALACVLEHGLEAVSMEMIIARSGLSTGAVYRYFKGKDEIISAGVVSGTSGLIRALTPVFANPDPPPFPEFIDQILTAALAYATADSDVDRLLVAIHGWSHSQSDAALKAATLAIFRGLRDQCAETVKKWQAAGSVDPAVDPHAIAQLILSICMGFVAQRSMAGDADAKAHVAALQALIQPRPAKS